MLNLNDNNQAKILLWGVKISPYVRKVMVALAEKKISYEQREILPKVLLLATGQAVPTEFAEISPLGKIPALTINNFSIADSAVICAYLDKKFTTGTKLYPSNPEELARALWFERYSDQVLTSVGYTKIFLECVVKPNVLNIATDQEVVEKAKQHELPPILNYLEKTLETNQWLTGENFSIADIAIATQLLALKMAGFELNPATSPKLSNYFNKVIRRPSFKEII